MERHLCFVEGVNNGRQVFLNSGGLCKVLRSPKSSYSVHHVADYGRGWCAGMKRVDTRDDFRNVERGLVTVMRVYQTDLLKPDFGAIPQDFVSGVAIVRGVKKAGSIAALDVLPD